MARQIFHQLNSFKLVMDATISTEAECVALIFCFVAHDQGGDESVKDHGYYTSNCGMEVQIMREGKVVSETGLLPLRRADDCDQVYLWTFRREHPVVQSLQLANRICVFARSIYRGWKITVLEGAICVVHAELDIDLSLVSNSKLQSRTSSEKLATKLGQLVLVDNWIGK